ncbi:MAG: type I DNA topoisomerase [Bdellovibrionales bacterium]|nr:type I DNA topoisomerase [Bdellovibrionales bacterium]
MSQKNVLVIVESPTKAKTIKKFLPKNFVVEASMGHVRDLPQSATEIPASVKDQEWTKIGVNIEKDFEPLYVTPKGKSKVIQALRARMKDADELYLATDEDREGESISWHLIQVLKPKIPVKRMVFHEITKNAILKAIENPRDLDERLVRAQETRRILDRLVGYTLSPLIWKKIAYGLSAGRVQSAGLRVIVDRERERLRFVKASYWDVEAMLEKGGKEFAAKLLSIGGTRIATGKDFDETTGKLSEGKTVRILGEADAAALVSKLQGAPFTVTSVEEKETSARPAPPFITSTLQQEANRKLGLSASQAMRIAQRLYEEGLITYMRTDSPSLSSEAIGGARRSVEELYGKEYLSPEPRQYSAKAKGAQEAHEAIRPAGADFVHPKDTGLDGRELQVYELIWKRTVATQMAEAKKLQVSVRLDAGDAQFSASGTRILFPGFLRAYVEGSDDPDQELGEREVILPDLKEKDQAKSKKLEALPHETKPPARFTEASLVQTLEKEGVGRPSTYATIIQTIQDRGYVRKVGNALIPTFTGVAVSQLLERYFDHLVDLGFTSQMEKSLDEIAEGKREWLPYLKEFYLGKTGLLPSVQQQEKKIDPTESRTVQLLKLPGVDIKVGRYGAYVIKHGVKKAVGHGPAPKLKPDPKPKKLKKGEVAKDPAALDEIHVSIPEDVAPADLTAELLNELIAVQEKGPSPIGKHPDDGKNIYVLMGRYGPYLQLGEMPEDGSKPKRASVPKGVDYKNVPMDIAVKLLSLPRNLGAHPTSGKEILANLGRFGPYVVHDGDFRSLKKDDDLYTVSLARAVELLSEEKKGRGGSKLIRELGKHPDDGKVIGMYEGKYGIYVKHGSKNAGIPRDSEPDKVTLEQALLVLANAKGGKGKRGAGGKAGGRGKGAAGAGAGAGDDSADDAALDEAGADGIPEGTIAPPPKAKAPGGAVKKARAGEKAAAPKKPAEPKPAAGKPAAPKAGAAKAPKA